MARPRIAAPATPRGRARQLLTRGAGRSAAEAEELIAVLAQLAGVTVPAAGTPPAPATPPADGGVTARPAGPR